MSRFRSLPVSFLGLCACAGLLPAQTAPAPLDRVEPYTLQLGADGRPLDGYFYLGFVHGQPWQMVNLGFNGRQSTSRSSAPFYGEPFSEPQVRRDPYGLRYYSLAWGANSLSQATGWARAKAGKNGRLTPAEERLAGLPPAVSADGQSRKTRAALNLFDPATVDLLHTYARSHVETWSKDTPARATGTLIDRWGLDNEWEGAGGPDYSPEARAAFAAWLAAAYAGRIDDLNAAWKTSHADFAAAAQGTLPVTADYATRPGAFLDWWTFQTDHFVTTLAGLARTLHETDPLHRGVVHKSTQQTIEMPGVNRTHLFDHDRFAELMRPFSGGFYGIDMYGAGDRQAYELNFIYNCIRPLDGAPGYGVFLPETNNHGGPANAFAATAWRMLANGLKAADLFTLGFAGAKDDWDKFGFINPATGAPKEKLFYAARWAHAIHRTEAFWAKSVPAAGLPRVALLMPRRDVLLSPLSERTRSRWSYPRNHRWMVYRWLREQGYWVDVIPYSKLTAGNLANYQGLFLIGAAHLTDPEVKAVGGFASAGGVIVADSTPGAFDEHHRARPAALLPFVPAAADEGETALKLDDHSVVAQGALTLKSVGSAQVLATATSGQPAALLSPAGQGRVLYFPFELGSLILRQPGEAMPAFLAEGPTADSEEYIVPSGELAIGHWLGGLLRQAGLLPAVTGPVASASAGNLRVEQPYVDAAGNVAVVVTTRADSAPRPLPAGSLTLPLPGGPWTRALFAPAEHDGLVEIPVRPTGAGHHELTLPSIPTAGIVYLFKAHEPVLGIPAIEAPARSIDGFNAKVSPGRPFTLVVQLYNTTGAPLGAGTLRALVPAGWRIDHPEAATPALAAGASHQATFSVSPEADSALLKPDWIYPLVVRWNDGSRDRAVISANVEVATDPARISLLLSGNESYPSTYPHRLDTGATYRFDAPAKGKVLDPADKKGSPALTNGFDNKTGGRSSGDGSLARFALINDTRAEITFDLQAEREVRSVVITRGPRGPAPARLRVVVGDATRGHAVLAEQTLDPEALEYRTPAGSLRGRLVTIQLEWPAAGGSLDEIEIWGR